MQELLAHLWNINEEVFQKSGVVAQGFQQTLEKMAPFLSWKAKIYDWGVISHSGVLQHIYARSGITVQFEGDRKAILIFTPTCEIPEEYSSDDIVTAVESVIYKLGVRYCYCDACNY